MSRGSDRPAVPSSSGKALASLILGLLSFCIPVVPGLIGVILGLLGLKDVKASGGMVTGGGMAIGGIAASLIGSLVSCLGCGYSGYRFYDSFSTARDRMMITNNLKQIGLAVHNYHDSTMHFPSNIKGPNGQALLSWRVAILPYIEQGSLYSQFDLTQPWDSPRNKALLNQMPRIYAARPLEYVPGQTTTTPYRGFAGPGAIFEDIPSGGKPIGIMNVTDGTSNTILIVEASEQVPWTKPDDLPFAPSQPLPKLGGFKPGGFYALFADGSIHYIPDSTPESNIKAMITREGGEAVPIP